MSRIKIAFPPLSTSDSTSALFTMPTSIKKIAAVSTLFCAAVLFSLEAHAQQLLRDTEIEEWIDDYSKPLFRAAGLPADGINIWLIGDPTPNAFAGGLNMGIHTGLITLADTPNQIQGVIAHETGHIAGGHTARTDDALAAASRPMLLSLVLAGAAVAAGAPEAGIGLLGLGQNIGLANVLKFSRGQESSADQAAITYLDQVGASSEGLVEFFGKLRNMQVITGRRVNPYLQTHPLANQRMSALNERVQKSPHTDKKDSPEEIARLRLIQGKIKGFLQEPHFTLREYPLQDKSDPALYARAVAYFRSSEIDKALAEINTLLERQPENPYFHELKGQMLFEYGRVSQSIAPHRKSVELAPNKPLLRINLGRALLATEDKSQFEESATILRSALQLEKDNAFAWFELARAYGGMGQLGKAHLATAESKYFAGDKQGANQFARRAMRELKQGTADWRRATDIILTTQEEGGGNGGNRRNGPTGGGPGGGQPEGERGEGAEGPAPQTDDGTEPTKQRPGEVPDPS